MGYYEIIIGGYENIFLQTINALGAKYIRIYEKRKETKRIYSTARRM